MFPHLTQNQLTLRLVSCNWNLNFWLRINVARVCHVVVQLQPHSPAAADCGLRSLTARTTLRRRGRKQHELVSRLPSETRVAVFGMVMPPPSPSLAALNCCSHRITLQWLVNYSCLDMYHRFREAKMGSSPRGKKLCWWVGHGDSLRLHVLVRVQFFELLNRTPPSLRAIELGFLNTDKVYCTIKCISILPNSRSPRVHCPTLGFRIDTFMIVFGVFLDGKTGKTLARGPSSPKSAPVQT